MIARSEQTLTDLFRRRLGYPTSSIEPRIIASAFATSLRVAVYGFGDLVKAGLEPPAPNEIGPPELLGLCARHTEAADSARLNETGT
jgi:hypothetical protein